MRGAADHERLRPVTGFDRIVVGVDGTPESIDVARLAARLRPPDGRLVLVTVEEIGMAAQAGWAAGAAAAALETEARGALEGALATVPDAATRRHHPSARSSRRLPPPTSSSSAAAGSTASARSEA